MWVPEGEKQSRARFAKLCLNTLMDGSELVSHNGGAGAAALVSSN
jgi:hypothetical protein